MPIGSRAMTLETSTIGEDYVYKPFANLRREMKAAEISLGLG